MAILCIGRVPRPQRELDPHRTDGPDLDFRPTPDSSVCGSLASALACIRVARPRWGLPRCSGITGDRVVPAHRLCFADKAVDCGPRSVRPPWSAWSAGAGV